jgi:hypothetical protein
VNLEIMDEELQIDLSVLTVEPAEEYHSKSAKYLSSHQLSDFMRCPYLHHKKRVKLIQDKDSPAYLVLVQANFAAFFIVRAQKELEMPLFLRING